MLIDKRAERPDLPDVEEAEAEVAEEAVVGRTTKPQGSAGGAVWGNTEGEPSLPPPDACRSRARKLPSCR